MVCFSVVRLFIYLSFRAAINAIFAFLSSLRSSALYCFCYIESVLINKWLIDWLIDLLSVKNETADSVDVVCNHIRRSQLFTTAT